MSNYNSLKATIDANIKQNGRQEITGQILNSVLNQMVTTLGAGYQFAGVATTATNPGSPDAKVFYIANGKGTYTNFSSLEVTEDEVVVLYYDTEWHKVATGIASQAKLTELESKVAYNKLLSNDTKASMVLVGLKTNCAYKKIVLNWLKSQNAQDSEYYSKIIFIYAYTSDSDYEEYQFLCGQGEGVPNGEDLFTKIMPNGNYIQIHCVWDNTEFDSIKDSNYELNPTAIIYDNHEVIDKNAENISNLQNVVVPNLGGHHIESVEFSEEEKFLFDNSIVDAPGSLYAITPTISIIDCNSISINNAIANENGVVAYAFYDKNLRLVGKNPEVIQETYINTVLYKQDFPQNAIYFRATNYKSHPGNITVEGFKIGKLIVDVSTLKETVDGKQNSVVHTYATAEEDATKSDSEKGFEYFLYGTSHLQAAGSFWRHTYYIDIEGAYSVKVVNTRAQANGVLAWVLYDKDKNIIKTNDPVSQDTVITEEILLDAYPNAKYIRCTEYAETGEETVTVNYITQGLKEEVKSLKEKVETIPFIPENIVEYVKSDSLDYMYDKSFTPNSHVGVDGRVTYHDYFLTSALIPIQPNTMYVVFAEDKENGFYRTTFGAFDKVQYDENKQVIPDSYDSNKQSFTSLPNAKYFRFSVLNKDYPDVGETTGFENLNNVIMQKDTLEAIIPFSNNIAKECMPYSSLYNKTWLLIGDSITHHNFRAAANYHDFIKAETGCKTINFGVSGGGYRISNSSALQFEQTIDTFMAMSEYQNIKPDFITIMAGINDMEFDTAPFGEVTDTTTDTLLGCVYRLLQKIDSYFPDVIVGIMTPLAEIHFQDIDNSSEIRHRLNFTSEHPITSINVGDTYQGKAVNTGTYQYTVTEVHVEDDGTGYIYVTAQEITTGFPNIRVCPNYTDTFTKKGGSGDDSITYTSMSSNMLNLFVKKLKEFCEYHNVPLLDQYHNTGLLPWKPSFNYKYFRYNTQQETGDGLHPNYLGHKRIYPRIREFVKTLV